MSLPPLLAGAAGVESLVLDDESESLEELLSLEWWSLTAADDLPRLSVTYHPLPLKTTGGAWSTRLAVPLPHSWHTCVTSAEKLSRRSYVALHAGQ